MVRKSPGFLRLAVFAGGVAVPVAASLLFNLGVSGRPVPITTSFGVNFYLGNAGEADTMNPFRFGEGNSVRIEADRQALGGAERSAFFRDRALEAIGENPSRWVRLVARKLLIFIGRTEVDNNADIAERKAAWKHGFLPRLGFGMIFPLAVLGMFNVAGAYRRAAPLVIAYLGFALLTVVFFSCERFRLPAIAIMIPLAALGIEVLVNRLRHPGFGRLGLSVLIIAVAAVVSNVDWLGISDVEFASITVNKAHVYRLDGDFDRARQLVATALAQEPDNAGAFFQLGAMEEAEGNLARAACSYLDSLERDPFFYASYAGARRMLEQADISVSYLDRFIEKVIDHGETGQARAGLERFLQERLP